MSLDVYLKVAEPVRVVRGPRIFVRENGGVREITLEEWDERFPGAEPVTLSGGEDETSYVYEANITHNLGWMAREAGIYQHLWRPEEIGVTHARQLIEPLKNGLALMCADPEKFKEFNATNGWGTYDQFVPWIERYVRACEEFPEAAVEVSR